MPHDGGGGGGGSLIYFDINAVQNFVMEQRIYSGYLHIAIAQTTLHEL